MAEKYAKDLDFNVGNGEAVVDASKKVRVGIIGCGWIAGAHMNALIKQPDVEIVAGCDLIPGKAAAFFEKYAGKPGVSPDIKTGYKGDPIADGHDCPDIVSDDLIFIVSDLFL